MQTLLVIYLLGMVPLIVIALVAHNTIGKTNPSYRISLRALPYLLGTLLFSWIAVLVICGYLLDDDDF